MLGLVPKTVGAKSADVAVAEPSIQVRSHPAESEPGNDWLCAWCLQPVARDEDRFAHGGKCEFLFANPEGVRFNILTFSRTIGGHEVGEPTLDHTWFPGHAWSYCLCDQCHMHLGWQYRGPFEFVGLIRNRIVRASVIMS